MKSTLITAAAVAMLAAADTQAQQPGSGNMDTIYDIGVTRIDGTATNLAEFKGKVMLIVNVASKCGFTGQYAGLQKLYEARKDRGLVVLGFPSNDFMGQEPGTNEEIAQFCSAQYNVTFPMYSKLSVKESGMHPLYKLLTTHPQFGGEITWNFNKFLIGRDGSIAARFGSRTPPEDPKLVEAVEQALGDTGAD